MNEILLGTKRGFVKSPTIAVKIALREFVFPFMVTVLAPVQAVLPVSTNKFLSALAMLLSVEQADKARIPTASTASDFITYSVDFCAGGLRRGCYINRLLALLGT